LKQARRCSDSAALDCLQTSSETISGGVELCFEFTGLVKAAYEADLDRSRADAGFEQESSAAAAAHFCSAGEAEITPQRNRTYPRA
jgi:hypothetical protein